MARYRKLPVIIEAEKVSDLLYEFKHNFNRLPQWVIDAYDNYIINTITDNDFIVCTLEGTVIATKDDYLVKGIDGELYPCKIDIFEKTYERV
jgi:hypothetical protein